jgi:hypothetical protein
MGKRSGTLDHEADFFAAPIADLDREVARCEMMMQISTSTRNRKELASRLHWLGKVRARHPEQSR